MWSWNDPKGGSSERTVSCAFVRILVMTVTEWIFVLSHREGSNLATIHNCFVDRGLLFSEKHRFPHLVFGDCEGVNRIALLPNVPNES